MRVQVKYPGDLTASMPFSLSRTGVLKATGAVIQGTITADTGKIGPWSIDDQSLKYMLDSGEIIASMTVFKNKSELIFNEIRTNSVNVSDKIKIDNTTIQMLRRTYGTYGNYNETVTYTAHIVGTKLTVTASIDQPNGTSGPLNCGCKVKISWATNKTATLTIALQINKDKQSGSYTIDVFNLVNSYVYNIEATVVENIITTVQNYGKNGGGTDAFLSPGYYFGM